MATDSVARALAMQALNGGGSGGTTYTAGLNIQISDDHVISATDTTYTAGDNITISADNEISASSPKEIQISATEPTADSVVFWLDTDGTPESDIATKTWVTQKNYANTDYVATYVNTHKNYTAGTNVQISSDNIISATDTIYELPKASEDTLGGVKVGSGLSVDDDGVISANGGAYSAGDNITIENSVISAVDTTYTAGDNITISDDYEISAVDTTYTAGTGIAISDANEISNTLMGVNRYGDGTFTFSETTNVIGFADTGSWMTASHSGALANGKASGGATIQAAEVGAFATGDSLSSGLIGAEGNGAIANGLASSATIKANAIGAIAHGKATGGGTIQAQGIGSIAGGTTESSGTIMTYNHGSLAHGIASNGTIKANGTAEIAFGHATGGAEINAYGNGSFAGGVANGTYGEVKAASNGSFVWGGGVQTNNTFQTAFGCCNKTGGFFMVGNGSSNTSRSNAFRVDWGGNSYCAGTFSGGGADYAEYFEWADGNEQAEDRIGYLVTLEGDKIKYADGDDFVLGIISGTATVIGDACGMDWTGRWEKDEFDRVKWIETTIDGETVKTRIETAEYDPAVEYIPREERKEWDAVGMMGKLIVRDDGTANVGDFIRPANGIATKADGRTNMIVIARLADNIIKVVMK